MTIVTVVTIKLTAGAVSKIPSQSSQPSRGAQRESLPQGRFWLAESAFALLSRKVTKAKLLFIYKEDYEEDDKCDGRQRFGQS